MKLFRLPLFALLLFACSCAAPRPATHGSNKTVEEKYAHLLGVGKEDISNKKLYAFIDEWYGVPYKYAGKTKNGVDCSGLTSLLLKEVYGKQMSGSSSSLYSQCKHISKKELQEGDLVFFRIDSKDISHVGVYLQNNKFVHVTTKAGVMIDDLDEEYYRKYFVGGGKIQ